MAQWENDPVVEDQKPAWESDPIVGDHPSKAGATGVNTVEDVARSGVAGLGQAAEMTAGIFGDVSNVGNMVGKWLGDKARAVMGKPPLTPEQEQQVESLRWHPPSTSDVAAVVNRYAPQAVSAAINYQPQTTAGEYARTAGSFVGASALGGPRAMMSAIPAAVASETAGQATKGTAFEPYARVAASFAPGMMTKAVTPIAIPAERRAATTALRNEGVTELTPGQVTGSNKLKYTESELGGSRMADIVDKQGEQFTKAVLKKAGIDASRATPEVIDDAYARIGGEFDALANSGNAARADQGFVRDFSDALDNYGKFVEKPNRAPVVGRYAQEIANVVQKNNGVIPPDVYKSIRSRLSMDSRNAPQSDVQAALSNIIDALDGAMARANPAEAARWREARRQYRNMFVIRRAATAAGQKAATGLISPANLRTATITEQGRNNYARGKTEFDKLARSGQTVDLMREPPNSGTAARQAVRNLIAWPSAALGSAAGFSVGSIPGAVAGGILGAAVPALSGRALLSTPARAYFGNQLMSRLPRSRGAMIYRSTIPLRNPQDSSR